MGLLDELNCLSGFVSTGHCNTKTPIQELTEDVRSSWNLNLLSGSRDAEAMSAEIRRSGAAAPTSPNEFSIIEAQNEAEAARAAEEAESKAMICRLLSESLAREQDLEILEGILDEVRHWRGHCPMLDEEAMRAERRLLARRAEIKQTLLEEHLDLYEHMQTETLIEDSRICDDGFTGWLKHSIGEIGWVNHRSDDGASRCVVCLEEAPTHVMVPCGHQCVCGGCAGSIGRNCHDKCPVCREPVLMGIRVFKP